MNDEPQHFEGFDAYRRPDGSQRPDASRGLDDAGTDIAFGGRRPRSRRTTAPRWPLARRRLTIGAVALLVIAIAVVVERRAGNDASPPTSVPATVAFDGPATSATRSTVAIANPGLDESTAPVSSGPRQTPLLANTSGWGLFISQYDTDGRTATVGRIDLATGAVTPVGRTFTNGVSVLIGSGDVATALSSADLGGATQAAPGPDGAVWVIDDSTPGASSPPTMRLLRPHTSVAPEVLATVDMSASGIGYLAGSTAEGAPVYSGPDGTLFAFDATTNTSERVASGSVMSYQRGNYSTIDCDEIGHCTVSIHGPTDTLTLDYFQGMRVSIAPDGTHALVGDIGGNPNQLNVVDLHTGASRSDITLSGIDVTHSFSAAWTPDSSTVVFLGNRSLLVVPVLARQLGSPITLPDDFLDYDSLLGIA